MGPEPRLADIPFHPRRQIHRSPAYTRTRRLLGQAGGCGRERQRPRRGQQLPLRLLRDQIHESLREAREETEASDSRPQSDLRLLLATRESLVSLQARQAEVVELLEAEDLAAAFTGAAHSDRCGARIGIFAVGSADRIPLARQALNSATAALSGRRPGAGLGRSRSAGRRGRGSRPRRGRSDSRSAPDRVRLSG